MELNLSIVKIRISLALIYMGMLSIIVSSPVFAAEIFSDSFESADMSTTSSDGFKWNTNNNTSVVIHNSSDGPVAVYNNKSIYNVHLLSMPGGRIRDWHAKNGTHSLRFRYAAGRKWAEQRFDLGSGYPEIWVSYWIRVPINYKRDSGRNNKWFDIQMAPMSQYQDTTVSRIEMQDWPDASGGFNINIQFRNGSDGKYRNSNSYKRFITPTDAGKWMHIVYHLKASTTTLSTDGIIRMYRRWDGESEYILINDLSNLNVGIGAGSVAAGRPGWAAGYLMGWANTPYATDTEWLLDDFSISDSSPLAGLLGTLPNPPTNLNIQ